MDIMQSLHRQQYKTTDFFRHVENIDDGLNSMEKYFVNKYFSTKKRTLEVGTGGGRIAFALEGQEGFDDIVGIDFLEDFVVEAKKKAASSGSKIRFERGNAIDLKFSSESFGQIIAFGVVLSHLPKRKDRLRALNEAWRVLEKNGIMILSVLNVMRKVWYLDLLRLYVKAIRKIYNPIQYEKNNLPRLGLGGKIDYFFFKKYKPQLHFYSPGELVYDLLESGFHVVELTSDCIRKESGSVQFNGPNLCLAARKEKQTEPKKGG
jgi:ubiquinone/menaquinone biosynthesis C-methylase UbiE